MFRALLRGGIDRSDRSSVQFMTHSRCIFAELAVGKSIETVAILKSNTDGLYRKKEKRKPDGYTKAYTV